jgi:hypothetical protein
MYCIVYKDKKSTDWKLFTNEVWMTRKEGEDYAKRNKFSKKQEWKVLWYDKKYKI